MKYLSIDTEYTSFYSPDRKKSGELLQVSIVPIIDGFPDRENSFNEYCRPLTSTWNSGAEKIHGISRSKAETFQHPMELAKKLDEWLRKFDIVFTCIGFNCTGDKNYIERLVMECKISREWFFKCKPEWIDVKKMATNRKHLISKKSFTLTSMCEYFGIDIVNAHDALFDAVATFLVWERLRAISDPRDGKQQYIDNQLTAMEKRRKYLDIKYVMMNGDGSVFITEHGTKNKEALKIIMEEIWCLFQEHKE